MTANTNPIFTLIPVIGAAQISTANTNLNGTGTIATVLTGGANGTRISRVVIKALGATTAGMVRLFLADGAGNIYLWKEITIAAITPSGTVTSFRYELTLLGETAIVLPPGYSLRAATHNAETFLVFAEGGDY